MDFSKNHMLWMALGCLIPILLLFALPYFGIPGSWLPFLFIAAMVVCHLMMMGGHGKHQGHGAARDSQNADERSKAGEKHEKEGSGSCH